MMNPFSIIIEQWFVAIRTWFNAELLAEIKKMEVQTMTQLDDLNTKIATIQTSISTLGTDLTKAIADLKAQIAAGQDLTAPLAALDAVATSLTSLDTQAKAE